MNSAYKMPRSTEFSTVKWRVIGASGRLTTGWVRFYERVKPGNLSEVERFSGLQSPLTKAPTFTPSASAIIFSVRSVMLCLPLSSR